MINKQLKKYNKKLKYYFIDKNTTKIEGELIRCSLKNANQGIASWYSALKYSEKIEIKSLKRLIRRFIKGYDSLDISINQIHFTAISEGRYIMLFVDFAFKRKIPIEVLS